MFRRFTLMHAYRWIIVFHYLIQYWTLVLAHLSIYKINRWDIGEHSIRIHRIPEFLLSIEFIGHQPWHISRAFCYWLRTPVLAHSISITGFTTYSTIHRMYKYSGAHAPIQAPWISACIRLFHTFNCPFQSSFDVTGTTTFCMGFGSPISIFSHLLSWMCIKWNRLCVSSRLHAACSCWSTSSSIHASLPNVCADKFLNENILCVLNREEILSWLSSLHWHHAFFSSSNY